MKSIVLSEQGQRWLAEHGITLQWWDAIMIEQYKSFVQISRGGEAFGMLPINIEFLQVVLELEIDDTFILINEIHDYHRNCE